MVKFAGSYALMQMGKAFLSVRHVPEADIQRLDVAALCLSEVIPPASHVESLLLHSKPVHTGYDSVRMSFVEFGALMQMSQGDRHVVAGELVLRPAALLGAALSCLRNTGLYMAARLGTTCKDVINDHSMWNMALVCAQLF